MENNITIDQTAKQMECINALIKECREVLKNADTETAKKVKASIAWLKELKSNLTLEVVDSICKLQGEQ